MAKVLFWYVFSQVCLCSLVSVRKDSLLWRVSSHIGFMGFVVSQVSYFSRFCSFFRSFVVSWFNRFRCVKVFVVTYVWWFQWFHRCYGFRGFKGFVVYEFCGFMGFVVSQVSWVSFFHESHLFLFIRTNISFMLKINTCTCQTQVERTNFYAAQKKKERKKVFSPILEEIYGIRGPGFWAPDGIFNKTLQTLLPKKCFYHPKKHANTVIVCTLQPIRRLEFLMPYAGNNVKALRKQLVL